MSGVALASAPRLAMIAAIGRNRVIGRDGAMPWQMPTDLAHFRDLTLGKPLVMGRRTFQSIGRPLPGRATLVVSADPAFTPAGVDVFADIAAALATARRIACDSGAEEVIVAGGGAIYAAVMARADRLYITHVDLAPEGDALFPPIDPAAWAPISSRPMIRGHRDEADAVFTLYERHGR